MGIFVSGSGQASKLFGVSAITIPIVGIFLVNAKFRFISILMILIESSKLFVILVTYRTRTKSFSGSISRSSISKVMIFPLEVTIHHELGEFHVFGIVFHLKNSGYQFWGARSSSRGVLTTFVITTTTSEKNCIFTFFVKNTF